MRLSDLVSGMSLSTFTEVATVIFLAVFATVLVRTFRRSSAAVQSELAQLPLVDDVATPRERP